MKKCTSIAVAALISCLAAVSIQASKPDPTPGKRTLSPLDVEVDATNQCESEPCPIPTVRVKVTDDCDSEYANIEYNFWVSVTYQLAEGGDEITASASGELENTVPLTPDPIDGCTETQGSTSFELPNIAAAINALQASLIPPDAYVISRNTGCQWVEAKAWAGSNSIKDSKPTKVPVPFTGCDVE